MLVRMSARALLLSGAGRYSDPWHPFAATSSAVAEILRGHGIDLAVRDDVDEALASLATEATDLLVLNIGDPAGPRPEGEATAAVDPESEARARAGLLAHVAAGRPVLALHVTSTSLGFIPEWEGILGGVWVRGTSMHPDYGPASISVETDAHPIVEGIHDFFTDDERYSWLRLAPDVQVLAWHEHDGERHPLLWARMAGSARIVYDALGHDEQSYASGPAREIVLRSARWLLGEL
jgi:hypothetical protein